MSILVDISENLQQGRAKEVQVLVQQAVDDGIPAQQILDEGLLAGMNVIGEKFKNNEVFVPEVLVAARAMNMGTAVLKPLLMESGIKAAGKVCIGTVKGDLHDIGKNLVKMMMEGKGLEVVDLSRLQYLASLRRKKAGRRLLIGVIGCMAERVRESLMNDHGVDIDRKSVV